MEPHVQHLEPVVAVDRVFLRPGASTTERDRLVWDAFRSGSREALDEIFRTHVARLFTYGSKFTKDRETVLDCIQDLFVELWNRRQSISPTDCIRYYLLKGLRRRITRAIHGAKRIETISQAAGYLDETIDFSAEHVLVAQETEQTTRARLKKAVEGLTRRQRESIHLKFYHGLDNSSIAAVMGLTEASVHTLVSQAVRALRSVM
jgi:RNA polymerase sigma factor (sigma-70 family)